MAQEYDDRQLICEGVCNPTIRDYDELVRRWRNTQEQFKPARRFDPPADMARDLKHTTHIAVGPEMWHNQLGWCRAWVCSTCGHRRFH